MQRNELGYPSVLSYPQSMIPGGNKEFHIIIVYPNTVILSLLFCLLKEMHFCVKKMTQDYRKHIKIKENLNNSYITILSSIRVIFIKENYVV